MTYFSEMLVKRGGPDERWLNDPVIICETSQTVERVDADQEGQLCYSNIAVATLINSLRQAHDPDNTVADVRTASQAIAAPTNPEAVEMFKCPIMGNVMEDPVVAANGVTYEREALLAFFHDCEESGVPCVDPDDDDRIQLNDQPLVDNVLLLMVIDECIQKRSEASYDAPIRGMGGRSRVELMAAFAQGNFNNLMSVIVAGSATTVASAVSGEASSGLSGMIAGGAVGLGAGSAVSTAGATAVAAKALITAPYQLVKLAMTSLPPASQPMPIVGDDEGEAISYRNHIGRAEIQIDKTDQNNLLGSGGFGDVWRGQYTVYRTQVGSDGVPTYVAEEADVAVKTFRGGFFSGYQDKVNTVRKVARNCRRLSCANLVKVYGLCEFRLDFMLVMELCSGGDLHALLHNPREVLTWERRKQILVDASSGLAYLHRQRILHRDVKPPNIMLDVDGNAKLTDFDLSANVDALVAGQQEVVGGTKIYMSPEAFQGVFTERADLWAFAIVMYEVALRVMPFAGQNITEADLRNGAARNLLTDIAAATTPEGYGDLVGQCWSERNEEVPTAEALRESLTALAV